uniref:Uncharacterized protein n=1 Tax=uncultured prokaryote TaxID=198431 RepID=A0A0H5QLK0_9ZZZZ|nr:hypothetical protein [uncultured prokaryote]
MATIIPPGFGELSVVLTGPLGTSPYVWTMGCRTADYAPDEYVDLCNTFMLNVDVTLMQRVNTALTLEYVQLQVEDGFGGSGSVRSDLPSVPGRNTGTFEPIAMAVIAQKNTAQLGRRGRGRAFLPGMLADANVDANGVIEPSARSTYEADWNSLLTAMATPAVGTAYAPVLLHADGSTPSPIVGGTIAPRVGWIRKRLR